MDILKLSAYVAAFATIVGAGWALDSTYTRQTSFKEAITLAFERIDYIELERIQVQIKRLEAIATKTKAEQEWLESLKRREARLIKSIEKHG